MSPTVFRIAAHGFWLLIEDHEYFLPFDDHPWFKEAKISQILHVVLQHGHPNLQPPDFLSSKWPASA